MLLDVLEPGSDVCQELVWGFVGGVCGSKSVGACWAKGAGRNRLGNGKGKGTATTHRGKQVYRAGSWRVWKRTVE